MANAWAILVAFLYTLDFLFKAGQAAKWNDPAKFVELLVAVVTLAGAVTLFPQKQDIIGPIRRVRLKRKRRRT